MTYFFSIESDIKISRIDLLRDCRPLRPCKIDLGKTGNHLYSRDRKDVALFLGTLYLCNPNIEAINNYTGHCEAIQPITSYITSGRYLHATQ